ncbi:MAG: N-acetylneuraminate synthase family protein [Nitrosopumilus sp.]|uniref:N-acetylneuraminate synthase family protein n=1 Tax=Nitrosopumilus sp. TaxID=2024843 RepID=UPI00247E91C5|nr:N-acetylneuraminate synthase family protein [Nitrosopumilus sp.]MCV0393563.1 N-acetylneuraminate synthase family protein [Nitrosopumilus sp.]
MFFVVAEIGVNWDGDKKIASEMIQAAKNAGCDAVKFQSFSEDMIKDHPESKRLIKSSILPENIEIIDNLAKSIGIEWFSTPMFPEAVEFLNPFVSRFKLREYDGRSLLKDVETELVKKIKKTKKEVIISSEKSPKNSKYWKDPQIKWLYVVPKYPCELNELQFQHIRDFDGFSNHCPEIIAPITAAVCGARIIEVHITSDKTRSFVDNPVSFDLNELRLLLEYIRKIERINF